ncbi:ACP S-malonyltransferase [Pasteuria penetrans]|uniref:ACP S-malonyltransferase n=1 Tax=Pasteuria penetrans TaxID=86005 RepID=UPI000FBB8414|nr:ACP S-malonyltransferase [Pasteuria penetrans]
MGNWLAWLFPGQGAQCVGMGIEAASVFSEARLIFEEADDILGEPLYQLVREGPAEKLTWTVHAQPAILTASYALAVALLRRLPKPPSWLAGHSLGEYTALVVARSLTFADALRIVRARGAFMDEAVPSGLGSMSAILGLSRNKIIALCEAVSREGYVVEVANYNSPTQIVISGHAAAVAATGERALVEGAKRVVPLPVSGPFHTTLMRESCRRLADFVRGVRVSSAVIPVVSNVTGKPMRGARTIQDYMVRQVASPVLWEQSMRYLLQRGVRCFTEIGPQSILLPLIRRLDKGVTVYPVTDSTTLLQTADALYDPLRKEEMMQRTITQSKNEQKRQAVFDTISGAWKEDRGKEGKKRGGNP